MINKDISSHVYLMFPEGSLEDFYVILCDTINETNLLT